MMENGIANTPDDYCPPTVCRAIRELLSYLWDDELKHCVCQPHLTGRHIFDSLLVLDGWLKAGTPRAETVTTGGEPLVGTAFSRDDPLDTRRTSK